MQHKAQHTKYTVDKEKIIVHLYINTK